ncbi:trypco2 family protein [Streptomyces collinus]|uniref:trypco2 family protein n=1 Tax=Streptomyces collinus TaxID=42684 RepID=UPI0036A05538
MIELVDVISELRKQLIASVAEGHGKGVRFELGPVELETTVVVTSGVDGGAKVRLWVVDANATSTYTESQTQRMKLTLTPKAVPADGSAPQSMLIAGGEVDGER